MGTEQACSQTENLRNTGSFIIKGLNIHTSLPGVAVATTGHSWRAGPVITMRMRHSVTCTRWFLTKSSTFTSCCKDVYFTCIVNLHFSCRLFQNLFGPLMLLAFSLQKVRPHFCYFGHTFGNVYALWYPSLLYLFLIFFWCVLFFLSSSCPITHINLLLLSLFSPFSFTSIPDWSSAPVATALSEMVEVLSQNSLVLLCCWLIFLNTYFVCTFSQCSWTQGIGHQSPGWERQEVRPQRCGTIQQSCVHLKRPFI